MVNQIATVVDTRVYMAENSQYDGQVCDPPIHPTECVDTDVPLVPSSSGLRSPEAGCHCGARDGARHSCLRSGAGAWRVGAHGSQVPQRSCANRSDVRHVDSEHGRYSNTSLVSP